MRQLTLCFNCGERKICSTIKKFQNIIQVIVEPDACTLKNLDPEKHGINMGLRGMSDFIELHIIKAMHNVICCLKVCLLTVA